MFNYSELSAVELSPTKKDYYQIWNELLDVASKLSERWDPTSTNESDPGIVLLKVLTAVADKLNYSIDANTLEAFMPSAAQEASMRKLCNMLGYSMKYFKSATTTAKISYKGSSFPSSGNIIIDQFTNLKDIDGNINYITLNEVRLQPGILSETVDCMEGELVECETDDNNVVSLLHLDDNRRYFLPETQIASNGIFIQNLVVSSNDTQANVTQKSEFWEQVDNLNAQQLGSHVFKFGFDGQTNAPYIQFPSDISALIEDGLQIRYVRTRGSSGNISINTLSKLEKPLSWSSQTTSNTDTTEETENSNEHYDVANYVVSNYAAARNGADPESINAAYWNYQKTVGVFDTLVTCRDYMNKIYQMTDGTAQQHALVSNVIVSDIRDDINRSFTLATLGNRGLEYQTQAIKEGNGDNSSDAINHFDLVLYPFKATYGLGSKDEYNASFTYDDSNLLEIKDQLNECKTISHNIILPRDIDITCIKVYFKLSARINTIYKVSSVEAADIEKIAHQALYKAFNMRQMTFGAELPYDSILEVLRNADPRIKDVSLDDPILELKASIKGKSVDVPLTASDSNGIDYFTRLVLRNVLAGKVALFEYNNNFTTDFSEKASTLVNDVISDVIVEGATEVTTSCEITVPSKITQDTPKLKLSEGEVVQFRLPNIITEKTYPAYVNYYVKLNNTIEANTDYELTEGEYLLINYSTSQGQEEGKTVPVNEYYGKGTIIRPNFSLKDSITASKDTRFYKTKAAGPWITGDGSPIDLDADADANNVSKIKGLFACGANEQIELRNFVKRELDLPQSKIFWVRNDEAALVDPEDENRLIFKFEDDKAYTLKEGEYLYFTDAAAEDIAYYGAGTEIRRGENTPEIHKYKKENTVTVEEINEQGLAAQIPWLTYDLSSDDKKLIITEYQYINLIAGDELKSVTFASQESTAEQSDETGSTEDNSTETNSKIDSTFKGVKDATYILNGTDSSLPKIAISSVAWEVRSKLELAAGPVHGQTIRAYSDGDWTIKDQLSITTSTGSIDSVAVANWSDLPLKDADGNITTKEQKLSFKANTLLFGYNTINLVSQNEDNSKDNSSISFKFYESAPVMRTTEGSTGEESISLGNIDQGKFTSISLKGSSSSASANTNITLHVLLPDKTIGLIAFYDQHTATSTEPDAKSSIPTLIAPNATLTIFNNKIDSEGTDSWWIEDYAPNSEGANEETKYPLRPGLNVVQISKSCDLRIEAPSNSSDILLFSNLSLIKTDGTDIKLNPRLGLKTTSKAVLDWIRSLDPDLKFFYNLPIDSNSGLDLNVNDDEDTLSLPKNWFDTNNVNNKFVVSEIDAAYLNKHVIVSKYSLR